MCVCVCVCVCENVPGTKDAARKINKVKNDGRVTHAATQQVLEAGDEVRLLARVKDARQSAARRKGWGDYRVALWWSSPVEETCIRRQYASSAHQEAAGLPRCANTSASDSAPVLRLVTIPHPLSHSLTLAPAATETGRESDGAGGSAGKLLRDVRVSVRVTKVARVGDKGGNMELTALNLGHSPRHLLVYFSGWPQRIPLKPKPWSLIPNQSCALALLCKPLLCC